MIKKFIIWHLNGIVAGMCDDLQILEFELCDYQDEPRRLNALIQKRADIVRVKKTIEIIQANNFNLPKDLLRYAQWSVVFLITTLTIIGMIVLPQIF